MYSEKLACHCCIGKYQAVEKGSLGGKKKGGGGSGLWFGGGAWKVKKEKTGVSQIWAGTAEPETDLLCCCCCCTTESMRRAERGGGSARSGLFHCSEAFLSSPFTLIDPPSLFSILAGVSSICHCLTLCLVLSLSSFTSRRGVCWRPAVQNKYSNLWWSCLRDLPCVAAAQLAKTYTSPHWLHQRLPNSNLAQLHKTSPRVCLRSSKGGGQLTLFYCDKVNAERRFGWMDGSTKHQTLITSKRLFVCKPLTVSVSDNKQM